MRSSYTKALLGSVCEVKRGTMITKKETTSGPVPVVAGGVGPAYYHSTSNRLAKTVTVSGSGANAGYVNYWDSPIWASDCSTVRTLDDAHDPRFFYYQLRSLGRAIAGLRTGAAQPHVHARDLARLEVVVPPAIEQKRIVAMLDEAFVGIDQAIENSKAALVAAQELFAAFRDKLLQDNAISPLQRLGRVCKIKHGFAFESRYFSSEGDYVLLTPGNFYERGGFRDRGKDQKKYRGPVPPAFVLDPGVLLVAMTEQAAGLLGSPLIVPEGHAYLHNQRLGLVVPLPGAAWDSRFFFHLFNSGTLRRYLHDGATGTKVRHTSPGKIEAFEARFPSTIAEQAQVSRRIDAVEKETMAEISIQESKLANLSELKQSLLARAFSGELTREPIAA